MTLTYHFVDAASTYMPQIFALRHEVFVIEQTVPTELEIDEYDADAIHLAVLDGSEVIGTLRIVVMNDVAKVGRVAVKQVWRRQGTGKKAMQRAMRHMRDLGCATMTLDAQADVIPFYEGLGFVAYGDLFMDAGIPHKKMSRVL